MGFNNSGRRPKPTALKVLRGNPGKRRLNMHEPKPPAGEVTEPAKLSAGARAVWDDVAPIALAMGTITLADRGAFCTFCELQASFDAVIVEKSRPEFRPLVMKSVVDGDGNIHLEARENPLMRMERAYAQSLRMYYEKFGLEPVARARMSVNKPDPEVSKWAEIGLS